MNISEQISKCEPNVKAYLEKRFKSYLEDISPELAEKLIFCDMVDEELGGIYDATAMRHWLYFIRRIFDSHPHITPELWNEWQAAKAAGYQRDARRVSYTACPPPDPAEQAKRIAEAAAARKEKLATEAAESERKAAESERIAAAEKRRAAMVAKLQPYGFPLVELEPVDYKKLHEMKKHPAKAKSDLARRWAEKFAALPQAVQVAWMALHSLTTLTTVSDPAPELADDDGDDGEPTPSDNTHFIFLTPFPPGQREIDNGNVDMVVAGLRGADFKRFRRFSEGVRRLIGLIGNPIDDVIDPPHDPHRPRPAQDLDDIEAPTKAAYLVPGLIPRCGLTVPHGDPGVGKSLWLQKIAIVVADKDGAKFEGVEVEHGQVIYATLDPSASPKEIKPGVIEIRDRLGLKPSGRLHITGAPLILNEPSSVEEWIRLNRERLPCRLIVVDSFFSAVIGSLAQDNVVQAAMDGVRTLLRHADAVVIAHHDNKGGDIFGSQFLTAMMTAKVGFVRNVLKDGRPGNRVTVTVERLKFDPPTLKLAYTLDGPFLVQGESASAADADGVSVRRPDILAVLPTLATPIGEARRLVEHMLGSGSPNARAEYWRRLRKDWEAAGLIVVKSDTIHRVA